jgi:Fic family protein
MLSKEDIEFGLRRLDELASAAGKRIEIALYGGAAMIMAFDGARRPTYDVDAVIRGGRGFALQATRTIADEKGWNAGWLNDAVKGFIAADEEMRPLDAWPDKEAGLVVQVASPDYLLAMKCMAMRLDADKHDLEDIKTLLAVCGMQKADTVLDLVERFYPHRQIPPKVSLGITSIFQEHLGIKVATVQRDHDTIQATPSRNVVEALPGQGLKAAMIENLGLFWEGNLSFAIPPAGSSKDALHIFKKNIAPITWHNMTTLERNPSTLPQTETILQGQSVTGLSLDDLMQVQRYGEGAKRLALMIADGTFALNEKTACDLHSHVGREEALTWGEFRDRLVAIATVNQYTPPDSSLLSGIAAKGFTFLETAITAPQERAVAAFLFMSRTQFFHDANKRTASLMMNGVLMQAGFYPMTIMNQNAEEFHTRLTDFYNTGNATQMMRFFERAAQENYRQQAQSQAANLTPRAEAIQRDHSTMQATLDQYDAGLKALTEANVQKLNDLLSQSEKNIQEQSSRIEALEKQRPRLFGKKKWRESMAVAKKQMGDLEKQKTQICRQMRTVKDDSLKAFREQNPDLAREQGRLCAEQKMRELQQHQQSSTQSQGRTLERTLTR